MIFVSSFFHLFWEKKSMRLLLLYLSQYVSKDYWWGVQCQVVTKRKRLKISSWNVIMEWMVWDEVFEIGLEVKTNEKYFL